jgi:hypothetical protein
MASVATPITIIGNSVGFGGLNRPTDVIVVQTLLNLVPQSQGGPSPRLPPDGVAGAPTLAAIRQFQERNLGSATGRVDPNSATLQRLASFTVPSRNQRFTDFNGEQVDQLIGDLDRAKVMIGRVLDILPIAPFLNGGTLVARMLLFNFSIDLTTGNPFERGFHLNRLKLLEARLRVLRNRVDEPVPMILAADNILDAFVAGRDPAIHVVPKYFAKTDAQRAVTLIHERAHTILNVPDHPGIGGPQAILVASATDDKRPFFLPPGDIFDNAIRNPYCYEWLILTLA